MNFTKPRSVRRQQQQGVHRSTSARQRPRCTIIQQASRGLQCLYTIDSTVCVVGVHVNDDGDTHYRLRLFTVQAMVTAQFSATIQKMTTVISTAVSCCAWDRRRQSKQIKKDVRDQESLSDTLRGLVGGASSSAHAQKTLPRPQLACELGAPTTI